MIKLVIIDPQKQERENIALSLSDRDDIRIIARGKDGYDALKLVGAMKPDIAVMSIGLEFIDGGEIPPLLKARSPSTALVIVAGALDDSRLFRAAVNGVSGFVNRETDMPMLPAILNCVFHGGCFISPLFAVRFLRFLSDSAVPETMGKILPGRSAGLPRAAPDRSRAPRFSPEDDPAGRLTKRELQILTCIAAGLSNEEIAGRLRYAVGTVRNNISLVMRKAGVRNRSELVRYAYRFGIIPLDRE